LIIHTLKGNPAFMREIMDRMEGKVAEAIAQLTTADEIRELLKTKAKERLAKRGNGNDGKNGGKRDSGPA
jgi:hypothetical protein